MAAAQRGKGDVSIGLKRLSTVDKINIVCVLLGLMLGVPLGRWLFPGSRWLSLGVAVWCGGFGYLIGFFINLIYVSRKYSGK